MSISTNAKRRNFLQTSTMLTGALFAMGVANQAYANPAGGNVVGGSASIANSGLHTEITQNSNRALIEWSSFNINQNESVNFAQQSSSSVALNRVVGSQAPSTIAGKLTANGNVIIVNGNGVMFTGTADVNVGGLVATTADIDNKDFMSGKLNFTKAGNANGTISNAGNIKVADGGLALFVGPNVTNSGLIEAKAGKVQLGSGDTFAVDLYGDGLLSLQASGDLSKQLVENSGKISANGGNVMLTAATAQSAIESVINMDGLIQADSVANKGGKVVLVSSKNNGTTLVSGKIKAAGGDVSVLGGNVGILTGAEIDVSGDLAGKIRIGGDFHGAGDTLTANNTVIQSGANLFANALLNGTGGDVAVWADNYTQFAGNIEAKGANGAKGGFVETSGKNILDASGNVLADTWLLDPANITISSAGANTNVTGNPNFTTTGDNAIVTTGSIQTNLNAGTNVVISTSGVGGSQTGIITVASNITKTAGGDATLTLNADNAINFNPNVTISSSSNKLNVALNAATDINMNGSGTNSISANGGDITLSAATLHFNSTANLNTTGIVTFKGAAPATSIGVSGGAGGLQVTNTILNNTTAWKIIIGSNTGTGDITANAHTWNSNVAFANGTGAININGAQALGNHDFSAQTASGNINIGAAGSVTTINSGTPIILAAGGNFINAHGASAVSAANGRWLIYSTNPANDSGTNTVGGLNSDFHRFSCSFGGSCPAMPANGNGFLYSVTPLLTITPTAATGTYGQNAPAFSSTITGYLLGDSATNNLTGSAGYTTTYSIGNNVNTYDITANAGTLASSLGYGFTGTTLGNGLTINPAALTLTAKDQTFTYGDDATLGIMGYTASGLYGADTIGSVTYGTDATHSTGGHNNVGHWALNISGATGGSASNYTISYVSGSLDITKRDLAITSVTAGNKVYDGNNSAVNVNLWTDNRASGDTALSYGWSSTTFDNKNVGNGKTVTVNGLFVVGTDAANYNLNTNVTTTANITPASLSIKANDQSFTYGATTTLGNGIVATGLVGGDLIDTVTYSTNDTKSGSNNWKAGSYTLSAANAAGTNFDANNYAISYVNGSLNIAQRILSISAAAANKSYDATTVATGTVNTDAIIGDNVTTSYTSAAFSDKNVANGKTVTFTGASLGGADLANYSYTIPAPLTALANITPATLTVKANNQSQVYGDGNVLGNGYQITGLQGGETVGSVDLSTNDTNSTSHNWNAGTYNIIAANATGGTFDIHNYDVHYTNGTLTVLKKNLTTTVTGQNKTYDATNAATVTFNDDRISGDVVSESAGSAIFQDKNVANGINVFVSNITTSGADAANYNLTNTSAVVTANITPAALNIKANDQSYVYGTANALNGYTPTGLQGGETIGNVDLTTNAGFSGSNHWNAGNWVITAANATGGTFNPNNYTVTYTNGALNIAQKVLTLTAAASNKSYDGNTAASATFTNDSIANDHVSTTFTDASFDTKDAGPHKTVTLNGAAVTGSDIGNYSYTLPAPLTTFADITKAGLVITLNNQNFTYGDAVALGNGFNSAGLQAGETVTGISYGTNDTFSGSHNYKAGTYNLTGSNATGSNGFNTANYDISFNNATLTIAQKALILTATAQNKVYDANTNASATLTNNHIAGDNVTSTFTNATFSDKDVANGKTVTLNGAAVGGADASNYSYSLPVTTTANITPAGLVVGANAVGMTYGDGNNFNGFYSVGLKGSDAITNVDLSTNATKSTSQNWNAGLWAINIGNATGANFSAGNYNITYVGSVLGIAQKKLTISAIASNKTYDATTTANVTLSDNHIANDVVVDNKTGANFSDKNVGNNKTVTVTGLSISGADAANYYIDTLNPFGPNFLNTATTHANITKAALTIQANTQEFTYGATTTLGNGFTASGLQGGETVTGVTYGTNDTKSTSHNWNAGTYNLTTSNATGAHGFNTSNYAITYANGVLKIDPKALTVTATGVNKVYDATTNATVTLADDRIAGDVFTDNYASATFADKNVANGIAIAVSGITLSGPDAANYSRNGTASTSANITPAALTVKAKNQTFVYGDTTVLGNGFTSTGLKGSDHIDGVTYGTTDTKSTSQNWNAGTYALSLSNATGANFNPNNYAIVYTDGTLKVNKRLLLIGADAHDKVYDATTNAVVTLVDTRIAGDVFDDNYTSANFINKNVGNNKLVTVNGLSISGDDAGNYTVINPLHKTLGLADITPATLTVIADNTGKVYGDSDPALTYHATGFAGSEDASIITGGLVRDAGETVAGGPYAINQGSVNAGGNYVINYVGGLFTITPASLHITADSFAINLGDAIPPFTYQATGFKFADDGSIISGSLAPIAANSLPGFYDILQGTLSVNSNYVIDYTPGVLAINSPFGDLSATELQTSEFNSANFHGKGASGSLLQIVNSNPAPQGGAGGLGGLAPAAGGDNPTGSIGDLAPASGAVSLIDCDDQHPCQAVE